jgi:hypothetical protein
VVRSTLPTITPACAGEDLLPHQSFKACGQTHPQGELRPGAMSRAKRVVADLDAPLGWGDELKQQAAVLAKALPTSKCAAGLHPRPRGGRATPPRTATRVCTVTAVIRPVRACACRRHVRRVASRRFQSTARLRREPCASDGSQQDTDYTHLTARMGRRARRRYCKGQEGQQCAGWQTAQRTAAKDGGRRRRAGHVRARYSASAAPLVARWARITLLTPAATWVLQQRGGNGRRGSGGNEENRACHATQAGSAAAGRG